MSETRFIYYNSSGIVYLDNKANSSLKGCNLWIDIVDPSEFDFKFLESEFEIDSDTIQLIRQGAKRAQVRILDKYVFGIYLDIRYKTFKKLLIEGIYTYLGKDWMITIHSSDVHILSSIKHTMEKKNKRILEASIEALYFVLVDEIIGRYEQLLTSIEITITDFEQESLYEKSSEEMLDYLDMITRQLIILRRHFWYTRDVINYQLHMEEQNKDLKYLKIIYDNITQLIDLIESYGDTINSTRDLYLANISLRLNDTMRILTIFSVVLLPLTLIAGIYGMNGLDLTKIDHLPSGLLDVLITMIVISVVLLLYFRHKKWIMVSKPVKVSNSIQFRTSRV